MIGKIDFIICEHEGSWFTKSHDVPKEIATKSNEEIVAWVKENLLTEDEDYFYIGVYWRDPNY